MKTITMDFETYEEEMRMSSRRANTALIRRLSVALKAFVNNDHKECACIIYEEFETDGDRLLEALGIDLEKVNAS